MVSLFRQIKTIVTFLFFFDHNPKIKICHMVASEHLDVVEGVRRLISTDILGPEEESEDSSIDYEVDALDE